jgi:hypothetical protein
MEWILIVAVGGFTGVSDVLFERMPAAQCRAAVDALTPIKSAVGAVCIGPNGETYEMK